VPEEKLKPTPAKSEKPAPGRPEELGDFTTTLRVIPISALAMLIEVVCAFVALALLRLIGLFTNLFYFGRWNPSMTSPAGNHLGFFSVLVPIGGALINLEEERRRERSLNFEFLLPRRRAELVTK